MSTKEDNSTSRLEELKGSKYEIVDGEPDITGWDVKNERGISLGEIDNVLFDPKSMKVRYLIIDTDTNDEGIDGRHVLVPIGIAQLQRNDKAVILPGINSSQLGGLPAYEKGKLTTREEMYIRTIFGNNNIAAERQTATIDNDTTEDDFYEHDHFNENRFYAPDRSHYRDTADSDEATDDLRSRDLADQNRIPIIEENLNVDKRNVETGRTRVTSRLVERPVEKTVTLKEERINVERVPVNRPATHADNAFLNTSVEIPEHREVPIVSKEARVIEEISLNKDVEERQETVRDNVRRTQVDIENIEANRRNRDADRH